MEERNQRPKEGSSLPAITLGVLVIVVVALLYIGYAYFMDEDAVTLTPQKVETSAMTESSSDNLASDVPTPQPVEPEAIDATPSGVVTSSSSSSESAAGSKDPAKKPEPKKEKPTDDKTTKKEETKSVSSRGGNISHKVAGGQTFYSVATKYGLSESQLKAANPDVEPGKVQAGKSLKVPVYATHTVGKGDILRVVAEKYGVSVDALMKANGKTKNYVEKGEKLIIPYPKK